MIKYVLLLTRKEGLDREQFTRHWIDIHAPLVAKVPGLCRYVQNRVGGERTTLGTSTGASGIDGIAELWYEDRAALERAARSPEMAALHADGALFIGRIDSFAVEEATMIGEPPRPASRRGTVGAENAAGGTNGAAAIEGDRS